MLGYDKRDGVHLIAEAPPDQSQVAPAEFGESGQNPVFGAPFTYRDLTRGYGQRRIRSRPNGRSWYALGVRTRAGRWVNGPLVTEYTPATRDAIYGVTRWFEINGRIYAVNGRYVLDGGTEGTSWTVNKDFGGSERAYDATVLQQGGSGTTRYALVALGDSTDSQKFDGSMWSAVTSVKARAFAVAEEEIWRATDTNKLWNCSLDADFTASGNWSSPTNRVGTGDHAISRLGIDARGGLVVCKADDIYTLDAQGNVHRLFGERQFPPLSTNGESLGRWKDSLYVTYGGAAYQLTPDGGLRACGPELLRDNGSEVKGYISAWVGTDFYALGAIYNPDTSASYLMEFTGEFIENEYGQPEPVWHGSITAAFNGRKITSLYQSTLGAQSGHKMAYIGFSDGSIGKYSLACTPDPSDCSAERFVLSGKLYFPRTYFLFSGEEKALHSATVEGDNLYTTRYATLSYRTSAQDAYATLSTQFASGERQSVDFPSGTSCVYLDSYLTLISGATTASPQLSGLIFDFQVRVEALSVFSASILATDGLRKRDGSHYRLGAAAIRNRVQELADTAGSVEFIDPEQQTRQVTVQAPRRTIAYDSMRKPHNAINVRLVEVRRNRIAGTIDRLEVLTIDGLSTTTIDGLDDLLD